MADDITCRLNVNSVTQVYSISLSAFIVYAKYAKMSMENLNCCSQTYASVDKMATEPVTLTPDKDGALRWPGMAE